MEPSAHRPGADPASDAPTGPRFNLRFEAGRGLLELARPLRAGPARIESLELSLGGVRFPVDVTAGPTRFRTRRTQVRSARIRFDPVDLRRAAEALGVGLVMGEPLADGAFPMAVRDESGVVAFDARFGAEGPDLLVHAARVRTATDGPAPPWARLDRAARRLGLELDASRGVWRWHRPVRALLAEAFVTRGWRVPDDRPADLGAPSRAEGALWIRLGSSAGAATESFEIARALAPVVVRLAAGELAAARDHLEAHERALGERPRAEPERVAAVRSLHAAALAEAPGHEEELTELLGDHGGPEASCLRLRAALRRGDANAAARAAERLASEEPLGALAAEGLVAASAALSSTDPEAAHALVRRALSRRPSDVSLIARCIELAELAGDASGVTELARRALSSPLPASERARLAATAARALERMTEPTDTEPLWREALYTDPDDPQALEGLGALCARRGDREAAVVRLDRAARAYASRDRERDAARVSQRSAELLAGGGKLAAAESRLEQAIELDPADPALRCALARVRVRLGALDAAAVAYAGLLDAHARAPAAWAHAVVEAAGFHLDDRADAEGARPFVEALARRAPDDPRIPPLRRRVDGETEPGDEGEGADQGEVGRALDAARADAGPPAVGELAEKLARSGELPSDLALLETLERNAIESADRAAIARQVARVHRDAGNDGAAALALARAGAAAGDAATLRAAIELAEGSGALAEALDVIDIALDVVGEGPARAGLLSRREAIDARRSKGG